jgi:hypothetical protein
VRQTAVVVWLRFVDPRLIAGPLQKNRGGRSGDAAADHQRSFVSCHSFSSLILYHFRILRIYLKN